MNKNYIIALFSAYIFVMFSSGINGLYYFSYLIIPFNLVLIWFFLKSLDKIQGLKWHLIILFIVFLWFALNTFWSPHSTYTLTRSILFLVNSVGAIAAGFLFIRLFEHKPLDTFFLILLVFNILFILANLFSLPFDFSWYSFDNVITYKGVTNHPNKLGQISLLLSIAPLFLLKTKYKYPAIIILLINLFFLLFANSRGALLIFTLLIFAYIIIVKFKYKKYVLIAVPSILLILFLNSSVKNYLLKNETSFGSNRVALIEGSIQGAKMGGLIGIGYGISSNEITLPFGEEGIVFQNFKREKMVSALGVVEETGLIGLVLILSLFGSGFFFLYKKGFTTTINIFLIFFISLHIYAQIEAWWLSVRSIPFLFYFMLMGIALNLGYEDNKLLNFEKVNN